MQSEIVKTDESSVSDRCRLILSVAVGACNSDTLIDALGGGDVASVILRDKGGDAGEFARRCKELVSVAQQRGVAVLVADDSQAAGRSGADGIFVANGINDLEDALARFSPHGIVGCGGLKNRHVALEAGERWPDFVFFGKLNGDIRREPHPKNLALANWWSEMIEIPCVVMGGNVIESVVEVSASGAEFVCLGEAVFANEGGPGQAVEKANELLDQYAPRFEEVE